MIPTPFAAALASAIAQRALPTGLTGTPPRGFCAVTAERQVVEVMRMASDKETLTGLSREEAQEFHRLFVKFAIAMSLAPFLAHISMWLYKPWL